MRNARLQAVCAVGGLVAPGVALIALFGSGMMPPQHANDSAADLAAFYGHHSDLKMAGLLVAFLAIGLLGPLVTVITLQLLRIEGRHPIMAFLQMVAGGVTWTFLSIPLLILFVTAYRPGRDPEITQALHDLGWILFLIPIAPFVVQNIAIAVAVLSDDAVDDSARVYPRWVAWANLLIGASFLPDALLGFFKVGPFAYHGLVSFWIPTVTYGLWLAIMAITTLRAVRHEARLEAATPAPEPAPALVAG
jgi:hypothetical protein